MPLKKMLATACCCLLLQSLFAQRPSRFQDAQTKKWGVEDAEWNVIVPAIYDEIEPHIDTVFAAKIGGKTALLNRDGSVRIPPIYQHLVPHFNNFNSNYGCVAMTKDEKTPNSWGMVDSYGKVVLPEKFRYVRPVNPDLFVGRAEGDSMLQFHNRKGELLYKIAGKQIEPLDLDNTCFGVVCPDHKTRFYQSNGALVYPQNPLLGFWTDGERTILMQNRNENNGWNNLGLVDKAGKVLIPYEYQKFRHGLEGQFIVKKEDEQHQFAGNAVFDKKGKAVIPLGRYQIIVFGKIYAALGYDTNLMGIFDANGREVLPMKFRYQQKVIPSDSEYGETIENSHPERYISLTDPETQQQFLVRNDGKIIRPDNAQNVRYFSENHPFVVEMTAPEGKIGLKKLMDINGRELLPEPYFSLVYTKNPRVFIGRKEQMSQQGFVHLDNPAAAEFKHERLERWQNGYCYGRTNHDVELYDPAFKSIFKGRYYLFGMPHKAQMLQFRAAKNMSGRLVAAGRAAGSKYEEWVGINEEGKEFYFQKKDNPPSDTKPVPAPPQQPAEKTASENGLIEVTEIPEGVMEEMPAKPTEENKVFDPAEKGPEFPGGPEAMRQFLSTNLKYPRIAAENDIQGVVYVSFIIEKDGSLTNAQLLRDIGNGCGQEALRTVSLMPRWTPGQVNGRVVRSKMTIPVKFKLN